MTITSTDTRLREVLATHFDPKWGTAYWLDRARDRGIDPCREIKTVEDLSRFGEMTQADLRQRPLVDYIPHQLHDQLDRLIIGQTGGTTGTPAWTAFTQDEFHVAFVEPFEVVAKYVDFPRRESWLFVGPSGPHLIGQAARAIARSMQSTEPFSVDFDPRWARKLTAGSVAAKRYLQHVIDQAMDVVNNQPIGVLFATPPVLLELAKAMSTAHRRRIRAVHYGGMAITPETMENLQTQAYPDALHLAGYGNTLLGCCLELRTEAGRPLDYFPHDDRLLLRTVDAEGNSAEAGQVMASRLDHSFLILNLRERDHAECVSVPRDAPEGFRAPGVRHPHTPQSTAPKLTSIGLY